MVSAQQWAKRLAPYRQGNDFRSWFELSITLAAFLANWALIYAVSFSSILAAGLLVIPAGGFLVRLFMLQHDCGHNALFSSRKVNDWVGRCLAVLTLTPYDFWRHSHAMHHAGSGNLDRRGMGDINTLTVEEYLDQGFWGRLGYRLYRHPLILFVIGPIYIFMIQQRLPFVSFQQGTASWMGVLLTNVALLAAASGMVFLLGFWPFVLVHFPIVFASASAGVWLFYVQHQFDDTHWKRTPEWNHDEAALSGSSYYDLPQPFKWFSGNIGIHHLHHLSCRIPFYRLPDVLRTYPELADIGRITFLQSLKCVKLVLWDEASERLVSFREARRTITQPQLLAAE